MNRLSPAVIDNPRQSIFHREVFENAWPNGRKRRRKRILIDTIPKLEFPASQTKQTTEDISNRYKTAPPLNSGEYRAKTHTEPQCSSPSSEVRPFGFGFAFGFDFAFGLGFDSDSNSKSGRLNTNGKGPQV